MSENETQIKEEKSFSIKFRAYIKNLFDFSHYSIKTIVYIILFVALVIISFSLLWFIYFGGGKTLLLTLIVEWIVNPIFFLGFFGILLFIVIMAIQGLLIPIPSEIVLIATGMIWGLTMGGIMGIVGSMAAALLCFYVSRKGGRPLAEKFVGKSAIEMSDDFIHKYGMGAIIIARFLPFVAFDPISYASGLVDMDVKKYSLGTLIGSIPRAFFYSWLGSSLIESQDLTPPINLGDLNLQEFEQLSANFNNVLLIVLAILIVMFIAYYLTSKYYEKKKIQRSWI